MSMIVELISFKKNKNSTAVGGGTSFGTFNVVLKEETSVVNPVFIIDMGYDGAPEGPDLIRANYLYCGHFRRRYWINDIIFVTDDVAEIHCTVDVLGTYINGIMNSEAYVNYANKSYNALIPDKRLPFTIANKYRGYKYKVTGLLSSGCWVVFVATSEATGQTGVTQGFLCGIADLAALAVWLFGTNLVDKVENILYSPCNALYSCMWLPCDPSLINAPSKPFKFGDDLVLGTYPTVKNTASSETKLTPILPYQDPVTGNYDWRNIPPYTNWFIWLPGVGYQEFPMDLCLNGDTQNVVITVLMQVSTTNGEISYTLKCNDVIIMFCKGNIGVAFPTPHSTNGLGNAIGAMAGAVSGLAAGAATLNPLILGAGAATAVSSAVGAGVGLLQHSVGASGAMGGLATPLAMRDYIELIAISSKTAEDPFGEIKDLIGCPVFKKAKLSTFTGGKVFCSNINYDWSGDMFPKEEEYEMIRAALTSQDGVWLEQSI